MNELQSQLDHFNARHAILESKLKGDKKLIKESKRLCIELKQQCRKNQESLTRLEQAMLDKQQAETYVTQMERARLRGAEVVYSRVQPEASRNPVRDMEHEDMDLDVDKEEVEEVSPRKQIKEDKCEFNLDGTKVVPALYNGMNLNGVLSMSSVEPRCREMIACHQFFELYHLHKADDLQFTQQRLVTEGSD